MARDGERLREIRERAEKATLGPWYVGEKITWMVRSSAFGNIAHCDLQGGPGNEADAVFIAHAREDIPYLLERLETLERENEKLREDMRQIHVSYGGGVW